MLPEVLESLAPWALAPSLPLPAAWREHWHQWLGLLLQMQQGQMLRVADDERLGWQGLWLGRGGRGVVGSKKRLGTSFLLLVAWQHVMKKTSLCLLPGPSPLAPSLAPERFLPSAGLTEVWPCCGLAAAPVGGGCPPVGAFCPSLGGQHLQNVTATCGECGLREVLVVAHQAWVLPEIRPPDLGGGEFDLVRWVSSVFLLVGLSDFLFPDGPPELDVSVSWQELLFFEGNNDNHVAAVGNRSHARQQARPLGVFLCVLAHRLKHDFPTIFGAWSIAEVVEGIWKNVLVAGYVCASDDQILGLAIRLPAG